MRFLTFHSFLSLVLFVQITQGTENSEEKPVRKPEVSTEALSSKDETQATESSLRSKRFHLVSEQKTVKKRPWKGIFGFDRPRNETKTKK